MQQLSETLKLAEALEAEGKYSEAADMTAQAMAQAHGSYVQAKVPDITFVRYPSNRDYMENYPKVRVDWQKWDRCSKLHLVGDRTWEDGDGDDDDDDDANEPTAGTPALIAASSSSSSGPGRSLSIHAASSRKSSAFRRASSSFANMGRSSSRSSFRGGGEGAPGDGAASTSGVGLTIVEEGPSDWRAETLDMQTDSDSGQVELVHTCCDGTRVATAVRPPAGIPPKAENQFNRDPKRTIKALLAGDAELCGEAGARASTSDGPVGFTHDEIARWLLTATKLSKNRIGDYLGRADDDAIRLLGCFLRPLDFTAFTFDEALRFFLSLFRLPGEAQQIDRIMQSFAFRYYDAHPTKFRVSDTAYILAFSLIMLNTDAHSDQIEHKMSLQQFLSNNRGIDEGQDLDKTMMTELYHSIVKNEIRMEQREFISSVKEGWLKKQGGRIKTWKRRYVILSGNVLYYFKSPKDRAPLGFVPLEGILVSVRADDRTFELRPNVDDGKTMKTVRMEGKGKKGGFKQGHHKAFIFRTDDAADKAETWARSIREHGVQAQQAQATVTRSNSAEEIPRPTVSFFRSKAKPVPKKRSFLTRKASSKLSSVEEAEEAAAEGAAAEGAAAEGAAGADAAGGPAEVPEAPPPGARGGCCG